MRLDRNVTQDGKYAVVHLRTLITLGPRDRDEADKALAFLVAAGVLKYGPAGDKDEFFVLKLRDRFAQAALFAYAFAVAIIDPEYGKDVRELAMRAGPSSPYCKLPD